MARWSLGEDVAEQVDYVLATFQIIRYVRASLRACVEITSLRRLRLAVVSNAVSPVQDRTPACWSLSSQTMNALPATGHVRGIAADSCCYHLRHGYRVADSGERAICPLR